MSLNRHNRKAALKKLAGDVYEFTIYDANSPEESAKWDSSLSKDVVAATNGKRYFLRLEPTGAISYEGDFNSLRSKKSSPEAYLGKLEGGAKDGWVIKTENSEIDPETRASLVEFLETKLADSSEIDMGEDYDKNLKERMADPASKDVKFDGSDSFEV